MTEHYGNAHMMPKWLLLFKMRPKGVIGGGDSACANAANVPNESYQQWRTIDESIERCKAKCLQNEFIIELYLISK